MISKRKSWYGPYLVEPSYIKNNKSDAKRAGNNRKMILVVTLSKTHSNMGKCDGKRKKRYEDCSRERAKPICLFHVNYRSSEQSKVIDDFGTRYDAIRNFK